MRVRKLICHKNTPFATSAPPAAWWLRGVDSGSLSTMADILRPRELFVTLPLMSAQFRMAIAASNSVESRCLGHTWSYNCEWSTSSLHDNNSIFRTRYCEGGRHGIQQYLDTALNAPFYTVGLVIYSRTVNHVFSLYYILALTRIIEEPK